MPWPRRRPVHAVGTDFQGQLLGRSPPSSDSSFAALSAFFAILRWFRTVVSSSETTQLGPSRSCTKWYTVARIDLLEFNRPRGMGGLGSPKVGPRKNERGIAEIERAHDWGGVGGQHRISGPHTHMRCFDACSGTDWRNPDRGSHSGSTPGGGTGQWRPDSPRRRAERMLITIPR